MLDATCGQYLQAARAADPGRNPSARRRAEAEEAQDALVDAMLWLHGYRTGVGGAQAAAQPLTGEWIADQARRLAEYCRANSQDGNMPLVDAARRL